MSLRHWWYWFRSLHLSKKWFIVLILIRPIIDNFYELKETSPLASPLYIVGILTPVLIAFSTLSQGLPKQNSVIEDFPLRIWGLILSVNVLIFWLMQFSISSFGDMIKYITPFFLYFYCRRFVQNREDLHGIMTSFLISCTFPLAVLIYESVFNPIAIEYISSGRGGGSRIRGAYADVMTYAIYLILFLLVSSYYFLNNIYRGISSIRVKPYQIIIVVVLVVYGLTRIRHVSTWGVFITILLIFLVHNLRNSKGIIFALFFSLIVSSFFAQDLYTENIEPLISKELLVVSGETESNQAFNGRMTRWEKYFEVWEQMPLYTHFFGIVPANFKETTAMISGGMHSDYVRLLFLTGFAGIFFYVLFLLLVLRKWLDLLMPEKYLIAATVIAILLWSITTVPTLYAPLLYIVMPVFAYATLPKERQY